MYSKKFMNTFVDTCSKL